MSDKREEAVDILDSRMFWQGWASLTARQCQRAIDLLAGEGRAREGWTHAQEAAELLAVLRDTAARYEERQKEQLAHYLKVKEAGWPKPDEPVAPAHHTSLHERATAKGARQDEMLAAVRDVHSAYREADIGVIRWLEEIGDITGRCNCCARGTFVPNAYVGELCDANRGCGHHRDRHGLGQPGNDQLKQRESEYQELLHCIWLHVNWRYVTGKCTTEQRELWAEAVEMVSERDHPGDGAKAERWWQE